MLLRFELGSHTLVIFTANQSKFLVAVLECDGNDLFVDYRYGQV